MNNSIETNTAPKAVGHYPHARRVGNLLFLSGIGPRSAVDNSIPGNVHRDDYSLESYDISAQCHSVFANVKAVLNASGSGAATSAQGSATRWPPPTSLQPASDYAHSHGRVARGSSVILSTAPRVRRKRQCHGADLRRRRAPTLPRDHGRRARRARGGLSDIPASDRSLTSVRCPQLER